MVGVALPLQLLCYLYLNQLYFKHISLTRDNAYEVFNLQSLISEKCQPTLIHQPH